MKYKMTYDHEDNFKSIREKKKKVQREARKQFMRESNELNVERKKRKLSRYADRDSYARFTKS